MGQVNLVRVGHEYVEDGGSITLTTGVLSRQPMEGSAAISLVNAGVEGFMRAAALELGPDLRVNCVSPGWVAETLEQMGRDPSDGVPAAQVAEAYVKSLNGSQNGEVIEVFG
jgi:NAD(P)-dependent dehydrogenase (short-subunit alcohol dehydrogenase family)